MASNVPLTGGYDCKFVETPPDKLMCQICLLVARTPHQVTCCGRVYCKACLDKNKTYSNACPNCRKTGQNFPDVRGEQEIKALKVKCNNDENGCDWKGELQSLDNHLATCGYALLRCTNKCIKNADFDSFTEEVYVLRRDLDKHLKNTCPNRQYQCPHCKDTGRHCEITTTHLDTCPKLMIPCPNVLCKASMPRCELSDHQTTCEYALLRCTNECTNNKEEVYVLRRDLDNHLNTCPNRQYQCPHCKDTGRHCEITTTHLDTCPKLMIPCPNVGCDASVPRCKLSDHQTKCLFGKARCKYAGIGCKEKPLRKDLQQHENNDRFHLHLAIETVNKQQKKMKAMKEEQRAMEEELRAIEDKQREMKVKQRAMTEEQSAMKGEQRAEKEEQRAIKENQGTMAALQIAMEEEQREMKQRAMEDNIVHTPCVFKMSNFNQHKTFNKEWYSPPFYIRPGSYKMCIGVDSNGHGYGKGTHVSVFVYFMRGKNDDNLSWPFRGEVTITLLNQLEDENHDTQTIRYTEDTHITYNRRVVDRDLACGGRGWHKFISHYRLGYDAEENCQYLKDDCLYFRITANPVKPWLTCTT